MIVKKITAIVLFFVSLSLISFAGTQPSATNNLESLRNFARLVVSNNRMIKVLTHDLNRASLQKQKGLSDFNPNLSFEYGSSKSENSTYNSITGIEEDYNTRRRHQSSSVSEKTPLGDLSLDYSLSKTEYTNSQASYFKSMYMGIQTGLLRRDYKINALERRLSFVGYDLERAQADSVLLDVLMNSFDSLFNEIIAARNSSLKRHNLEFYSTLVEEAQIKLKNGMGSELDLKQAKMRYNQADTTRKESELRVLAFDRDIGVILANKNWDKSIASFSLQNLVESVPKSIEPNKLVEIAKANRPDMRVIRSQYKLQKAAYDISCEKNKPNLNVRVRWGKQGRGASQSLASDLRDKNWDVVLSWTTKIGGRTEKIDYYLEKEKIRALKIKVEQKEAEVEKLVLKAIDDLEFYIKDLSSLRASEQLSAEVLEGQKLNFKLGKVSLLDLSRYQQDFDNASLAVVKGEVQLIKSWLGLMYQTGTLSDYFGIKSTKRSKNKYKIIPCKNN